LNVLSPLCDGFNLNTYFKWHFVPQNKQISHFQKSNKTLSGRVIDRR